MASPEKQLSYDRKWRKANPERASRIFRNSQLKSRYGITLATYEKLLLDQDGLCAICGKPPTGTRGLHVDHSHQSGQVRGLLCLKCNGGLGLLCDDVELLIKATHYLLDGE